MPDDCINQGAHQGSSHGSPPSPVAKPYTAIFSPIYTERSMSGLKRGGHTTFQSGMTFSAPIIYFLKKSFLPHFYSKKGLEAASIITTQYYS